MGRRIVVAGGGIAGLSAAKSAREQDPSSTVILLEAGDTNTYIRTRLPDYISGAATYRELFPYSDTWYDTNNITLKKNTTVTGIDTENRAVISDKGIFEFDALVIALGSSGNIPTIPGAGLLNCFTVRTISDAEKVKKLSGEGKTCTLIGGGLLGLEMAWAVRQLGCSINIIEHSPRLLSKQIDEQGSELLHKAINDKGIRLFLNSDVQEIGGDSKVEYVKLKDGTTIKTDYIILSAGVRANTQPLAASGLAVGRSIVVDEHMRTNLDDIYAAGDVAEYEGKNFSIWPIAVAQGKIAGGNAAGGSYKYDEISPFTTLKIKGITMFSMGDVFSADAKVVTELDEEKGRYVKLLIIDEAISGAIVFGDAGLPLIIKKAVEQKTKLPAAWEGLSVRELAEKLKIQKDV